MGYSWDIHGIFMGYSFMGYSFMGYSFMGYSFMGYSFMGYSFMGYSFMGYSFMGYSFMGYSWDIHGIFMGYPPFCGKNLGKYMGILSLRSTVGFVLGFAS